MEFNGFYGLYTALVTPFLSDGSLDVEGLIKLIQLQNKANVAGIVVLGTTGESATLDTTERKLVVKTAVEHSQVPVIVGTGSNCTRTTIEYTREAESLGAAAVQIVTPYYNRPTQEGLYLHFEAIHAASSLPIMLYSVQSRCGVNMLPQTVLRCAGLERIVAIKEASGSLTQLSEIVEKAVVERPEFAVLTGDDGSILPSIALGAVGAVSVLSNLLPVEANALVNLCLEGEFTEARVLHHQLMPLIRGLFVEANPIPVKAAMVMAGLPAGGCRAPLCAPSENALSLIQQCLQPML